MAQGANVVLTAYLGSCAIITYREFKNPTKGAPLPVPPPSKYVGAGIAFGMCGLLSEFIDPRVGGVLAVGLFVGLAFQTAQKTYSDSKTNPENQNEQLFNTTPATNT